MCNCVKKDGQQCTRSNEKDSNFCWQHQKCLKVYKGYPKAYESETEPEDDAAYKLLQQRREAQLKARPELQGRKVRPQSPGRRPRRPASPGRRPPPQIKRPASPGRKPVKALGEREAGRARLRVFRETNFFEGQSAALCAIHVMNNILQNGQRQIVAAQRAIPLIEWEFRDGRQVLENGNLNGPGIIRSIQDLRVDQIRAEEQEILQRLRADINSDFVTIEDKEIKRGQIARFHLSTQAEALQRAKYEFPLRQEGNLQYDLMVRMFTHLNLLTSNIQVGGPLPFPAPTENTYGYAVNLGGAHYTAIVRVGANWQDVDSLGYAGPILPSPMECIAFMETVNRRPVRLTRVNFR